MKLKEMQIAFKDFILDKAPMRSQAFFEENLNIYKANYYQNLASALDNKFPTIYKYLKKEGNKLFYQYIILNPSTSGNLDSYGDSFTEFLYSNNLIIEAELAKIDLMFCKAFNSPFEKPLDPQILQHITPESFNQLYFTLTGSLNLDIVDSEAYELWLQFNNNLLNHQLAPINELPINNRVPIAVYTKMFKVLTCGISTGNYQCIRALKEGKSLLSATEKALKSEQEFNLSDFLKFCFKNDLIINFRYNI